MNLFYFQLLDARKAYLEGEEAKHCVRVLRKKPGDRLIGVDGKGRKYNAVISGLGKNRVDLDLVESEEEWGEHGFRIELAISVLRKPDRLEWLAEKAVELGITHLRPLVTKRTVKPNLRLERLERIMISALKQCKRSRLPEVLPPQSLAEYLDEPFEGLSLIGWMEGALPVRDQEAAMQAHGAIRFLVGPEGGFDESEVEAARAAGFIRWRRFQCGHRLIKSCDWFTVALCVG